MYPSQRVVERQARRVRREAETSDSLSMFNLLTGPRLLETVERHLPPHRERLYPPTCVLAMFVAQALSADGSCQEAVDTAMVNRLIAGLKPGSADTGAYCKARRRLPVACLSGVARAAGVAVAEDVPDSWHWRGRAVRLVDGATVTLPDTAANQATYPQPRSQAPGLGFPQMRLVALLCLSCACLLDAATGPCEGKGGDEQALLRACLDSLTRGDILLGDAYYATYFLLCELVNAGVDGLFEQYGARRRSTDFSTGEALGERDHLIVLEKPKKRPEWMSPEEYAQAPDRLKVRELAIGGKILVTTFLDPTDTPKGMLRALYRRRWSVELDLRNLKTTLGMSELRCRTPAMAEKELWAYLLAYNLIRLLMVQAALLCDQVPRQLSFKHNVQVWLAWWRAGSASEDGACVHALLLFVGQPRVGLRPGRIEPRLLKRRQNRFGLLSEPREQARARVRRDGHGPKQR
jgi:hypothetical protein